MKMPICPTCQKIKLIRSKALTSINDPNSGKEYLACPRCLSKWYMDDPNRPIVIDDDKPKKSIWHTLSTWGAPHNEPDAFGVLHPLTYVFPSRHEYPSPFLPPTNTSRQSDVIPTKSPSSKSSIHTEPVAGPSEQPTSSAPEPVLLSPRQLSPRAPPPAIEQTTTFEQQNRIQEQTPEIQCSCKETSQTPKESPQVSQPVVPEGTSQPDEIPSAAVLVMSSEEQARFDLLSRIANSPLPAFLNTQRDDLYEPSVLSDNYQPSVASKTGHESLSREEQHLYDTLIRVAATPGPLSPMIYPSHTSSPKIALQELNSTESFRTELDNADRVRRKAERIEHAIQNSPFLSQRGLQTPLTEKQIDSPEFSQPKSPASKHSGLRSSRHSIAPSVPPTPRSTNKATSTPRSPCVDDQLPLPGAFPTPKTIPLTSEALGRLTKRSSHHVGSVRSGAPSTSLPVAPSNYEPMSRSQISKRGSLLSPARSPLFN